MNEPQPIPNVALAAGVCSNNQAQSAETDGGTLPQALVTLRFGEALEVLKSQRLNHSVVSRNNRKLTFAGGVQQSRHLPRKEGPTTSRPIHLRIHRVPLSCALVCQCYSQRRGFVIQTAR